MKKVLLLAFILSGSLALAGCATYTVQPTHAEVIVVTEPDLVFIPGNNVYVVAEPGVRIYFLGGFYYRYYGGYWHRSRHYEGPWEDWRQGVPFREPSDERIREERGRGHFVKPSEVYHENDNKRDIKQDREQPREQQKQNKEQQKQKQDKERQKKDNRDQDNRD